VYQGHEFAKRATFAGRCALGRSAVSVGSHPTLHHDRPRSGHLNVSRIVSIIASLKTERRRRYARSLLPGRTIPSPASFDQCAADRLNGPGTPSTSLRIFGTRLLAVSFVELSHRFGYSLCACRSPGRHQPRIAFQTCGAIVGKSLYLMSPPWHARRRCSVLDFISAEAHCPFLSLRLFHGGIFFK